MPSIETLPPEELAIFLMRYRRGETLDRFEPRLDYFLREILSKANEFVPSESGAIFLDDPRAKVFGRRSSQLTIIAAFLDRVAAVAPQGAIFFEDTELRMADKVVVLFEEVLATRHLARRCERLQRELYTVGPGLYIANAHPEVTQNLATCIGHLLRARGLRL